MYQEFDIRSAIAPEAPRTSYKMEGVSKVAKIYNSTSKSTEEFVMDAVANLGAADRNVLFVNSSLNALSDRLNIAGKVARAVNTSKARGVEGFQNVEYLNPWEYAIEGKAGNFFSKIWQAICSTCRRIIEMIANFIKWLGNVIASADTKAQIKDYRTYLSMGRKYPKEADKKQMSSLDWKVTGKDILNLAKDVAANYNQVFTTNSSDVKALEGISVSNAAKEVGNAGSLWSKIGRVFHCEGTYETVKRHIMTLKANIDSDLNGRITKIFKGAKGVTNAKQLVLGATTKSGKVGVITVGQMRKLSNDFSILEEGNFSKQIKETVAAVSKAQKEFTKYTKTINKLAKDFGSIDNNKTDDGRAPLSKLVAELSNSRLRASTYFNGLMLEIQSVSLRFCKSAHVALKQCIKAAKPAKETKSKESLDARSIESLFNF